MNIGDYKSNGRWSIQAIRAKADEIEIFRSKIIFLKTVIKQIKKSKPKGRETLSGNASITIKKIEKYIKKIELEAKKKNDFAIDDRGRWTGDAESLINIFFKLKNNTYGKDNRPLLDESNRKIAELIKNNFSIDLSIETIIDKLNSSKTLLKPNDVDFLLVKNKNQ